MPLSTQPSLDGLTFRLHSSTTSKVDPDSPSTFHYRERDGVVWGDYDGDTVTFGRFIGTREGDGISVRFVHVLAATGNVITGQGTSAIERDAATDTLRLIEHYEMHGAPQRSVCVQVPGA
ncbi:MAG: hypothetical protein Q4G40_05315 [Brachybacterium sp.]|nr:hypothetical protein [Brachybacterium sp.]